MPSSYAAANGRSPAQPANRHARDSNALRASVLDVFVQLGALQKNSLITEWMFEEENGRSAMHRRGREADMEEEDRGERGHGHGYQHGYDAGSEMQRLENQGIDNRVQSPSVESETRKGRSKFTSKITAVFRGRSKSKTRAEKASRSPTNILPPLPPPPSIPRHVGDSVGYETDEGYNSSSPSTPSGKRSKSRRRGVPVFPIKSRPSESSEISSSRPSTPSEFSSSRPSRDRGRAISPTSDTSGSFQAFSPVPSTSQTEKKSRFGRKPKETSTILERVSEKLVQDEGWEQFPPLTPGAFTPQVLGGTQLDRSKTSTPDVGDTSENQDGGALLKRLSFAIPRSNFQNPVKRKDTKRHRPPSLLPIMDPPAWEKDGASKSLPPSPFILVAPELGAAEFAGTPDTPYILCTPMDDETARARLSTPLKATDSPVYPLSVSKTIRRSIVLDSIHHTDENLPLERERTLDIPNDTSRLNRALSVQAPSAYSSSRRVYFADEERRPGLRRSLSATQRARDTPFPTRPVLPVPLSLSMHGPNARAVRLSLDARASVIRQRYRSGMEEQ